MKLRVLNRLCTNKYLHHYYHIHYWVLLFVFLMWHSSLINEDVFLNWVDFKLVFSIYVNHPPSPDRRGRYNPSGFLLQLRQSDRWPWRWVCWKMEASNGRRNARVRKARKKSKLRPISHSYDLLITLVEPVISIFFFFFVFGQIRFEGKVCVGSYLSKRREKNLINIFGRDNFYCTLYQDTI